MLKPLKFTYVWHKTAEQFQALEKVNGQYQEINTHALNFRGDKLQTSKVYGVPGNREAFAHLVRPEGGAFAILSPPGSWALAYPGANPGIWHTCFRKMDEFIVKAKASRRRKAIGALICVASIT